MDTKTGADIMEKVRAAHAALDALDALPLRGATAYEYREIRQVVAVLRSRAQALFELATIGEVEAVQKLVRELQSENTGTELGNEDAPTIPAAWLRDI